MIIEGGGSSNDLHMSVRATDSKGNSAEVSFGAPSAVGALIFHDGSAYSDTKKGGKVVAIAYTDDDGIKKVIDSLRVMSNRQPKGVYSVANQNCRWWSRWQYFYIVVGLHDKGHHVEEDDPSKVPDGGKQDQVPEVAANIGFGITTTRSASAAITATTAGPPAAGKLVVAGAVSGSSQATTTTTVSAQGAASGYGPAGHPSSLPAPSGDAPNQFKWIRENR
jgi:hypothetical protein